MINHRLRSLPVSGYYEYLSPSRCRVSVTPNEADETEQTPTQTTGSQQYCVATLMENANKTSLVKSSSADNVPHQLTEINTKDVTKWSSTDVQRWVEDQCRKFELTKATSEKFQMNGNVRAAHTDRSAPLFSSSSRSSVDAADETRLPAPFAGRRRDSLLRLTTIDQ